MAITRLLFRPIFNYQTIVQLQYKEFMAINALPHVASNRHITSVATRCLYMRVTCSLLYNSTHGRSRQHPMNLSRRQPRLGMPQPLARSWQQRIGRPLLNRSTCLRIGHDIHRADAIIFPTPSDTHFWQPHHRSLPIMARANATFGPPFFPPPPPNHISKVTSVLGRSRKRSCAYRKACPECTELGKPSQSRCYLRSRHLLHSHKWEWSGPDYGSAAFGKSISTLPSSSDLPSPVFLLF